MRIRRIFIIVAFVIVSAFLLSIAFSYNELGHIKDEGLVCFSAKILDWNLLGLRNKKHVSQVNILDISRDEHHIKGVMRSTHGKYLVVQQNSKLNLYTIRGKPSNGLTMTNEKIKSISITDLSSDNDDELLVITGDGDSKYGKTLKLYSFKGSLKCEFVQDFGDMKPWKVQTADVDGDGAEEISVGMYKTALFHNVMAKRPYLYNWHGNAISPKWRGSRLSKPFEDYVFTDIDCDGSDELIAIEILENGKRIIDTYNWKGFGFEGGAESIGFDDVLKVEPARSEKGVIYAEVRQENLIKWVALEYKANKLSILKYLRRYVPEI